MIKNIIFDLGGVVITLDQSQAIRRFEALGLKDAAQRLDAYTQEGIFGDLEGGRIDAETFRLELSKLVGNEVTHEQCAYAWQGYAKELPARNLEALIRLRQEGYRLLLLSNTNPYMMEWVGSEKFDGRGHSVDYYFDNLYLSYRMKLMKPNPEIFGNLLMAEQLRPSECLFLDDSPRNVAAASQMGIKTFCPENGADWTKDIYQFIK
ncbi:HAD family hydrolase [Xylanibacter brevis]|uniref:HAD family hydrolase n=1 Tax=Xylanibacter brevis TaxID=83231 RepID=UPI00047F1F0C|nr:HAD family phosphatase [Xylanibacter brevis]